jgi:hypothetical protein
MAFGRLKASLKKLNERGMLVSEKVHLREIVVILGADCPWGRSRSISPDRLLFAGSADISPRTPISALQGRNHGD